ncbi:ParA family protein (plasmid) [Acidithiobacillus caldus]|jgi:chromosome partitioning protein|uniref:Partition protein n=1 Tax=Acidithiobacillus caldus TaxID=33059 RepID=A0A1E7YIQ7_9PROT|nr:ParA family protein [Acidithiobacillus caldus]MBU2734433.1 ParA family protein [Acidithiobacillus caldus ATCC 51756]AUW34284.1 ParA family protein [Acidithiobacillus caldus]MBU2728477.1 ParA family protein [Acidithiobacillus caldus]MBU2746413.1 ParA family protein [Acidithiobacillus caldus]MBU2781509.1 ParA family protein [Acidithiobacillus caldus]
MLSYGGSTVAIFACVNTKGGVGKTTTAVHLAAMLAIHNPTLLIDGDPQASAASWAAWRRDNTDFKSSPTTTCLVGKAIVSEGRQLSQGFAHTVVDAGGRDSVGLRSALLLAQEAIVPVGASNLDAAAMTDLLTVVDMAKDYNPDLRVRILLTRLDPRTKDVIDMLSFLKEQELEVFNTTVCERVVYRRAVGDGATVHEIGKDRAAIAEMDAFLKEATS